MSLAKAIRAGVKVARTVVVKGDLTVTIKISPRIGSNDSARPVYGPAVSYEGLMKDIRETRRLSPGKKPVPVARHEVSIFEHVPVERNACIETPDGVRELVKVKHARDKSGTYMTTLYLR